MHNMRRVRSQAVTVEETQAEFVAVLLPVSPVEPEEAVLQSLQVVAVSP